MIEWLTDTLVATGALMVLVLVVRRPVSRWFGPGAAYALWALPMIRLVLPPLAVRPEFAPHFASMLHSAGGGVSEAAVAPTTGALLESGARVEVGMASAAVEPSLWSQVDWSVVAVGIWLGGAAAFIIWRTLTYRRMRRDLLQAARLVAHAEDVRIVETPAVRAPLAFGIFDKVIVLPQGFLANADCEMSDFVIAHELEHHKGNDLLALILMQPLFALHWFNPLGWSAWRAVRADQEAFCDARVMLGRSRAEKARYGRLIASMTGDARLSLAAPMAGPLSSEKPIIQRLKALAANEITAKRRVLGRSLFAAAVIAVPATATVSEAEAEDPGLAVGARFSSEGHVPAVLPDPSAPPRRSGGSLSTPSLASELVPPVSPERPVLLEGVVPSPPVAPMPPAPTVPPLPSVPPQRTADILLEADRVAGEQQEQAHRQAAAAVRSASRSLRYASEARRHAMEAQARAPRVEESVSADGTKRIVRIVRHDGSHAVHSTMIMDKDCPADSIGASRIDANGNREAVICTGEPKTARLAAVRGLQAARASIAANKGIAAAIRAEITADLDREIAESRR